MKINFFLSNDNRSGGNIYDTSVINILKEKYRINSHKAFTSYRSAGHSYIDLLYTSLRAKSESTDIDILDYTASTSFLPRLNGKRIIIFHHFDENENNKPKKYNVLFKRFLKNAQNATVVVVSQYWKDFLHTHNLKDVKIIYNSFDDKRYIATLDKKSFLLKYNLDDKPIIYIGKNSKSKSLKAFELLQQYKNGYNIVTTGKKIEFEGPKNLDLTFEDYINLLHFSSCTLLLTDFKEGWSRIAHESILCNTPVIGNGAGGMSELLEMTKQLQLKEYKASKLHNTIQSIIQNNVRVPKENKEALLGLNMLYFKESWFNLIENKI